ncbi:MAG: oxidoreductase [Rhodospirillales bacterium]
MADLAQIDIAPLFTDDSAAWRAVDRQVGQALDREGGFVIVGFHEAKLLDARCTTLLRFFDLDEAEKQALAVRSTNAEGPRIYRGYSAALSDDSWAHNEMFDIGPEAPTPGPALPGMEILAETNVWPTREPLAGWRAAMQAYHRQMSRVSLAVMLSAGRAKGIDDRELQARFEGGNSTLRLLNYPLPPKPLRVIDEEPDGEKQDGIALAAGRHTDGAGVSLLWQAQPGLQAQAPDGSWRDIPCLANSISVHLGDVLQIMTDGAVPATPHRVVDHGRARQSVGFFLEPALGARLSAIDHGETEESESARGTYGWHLLRRLHSYSGNETLIPLPD